MIKKFSHTIKDHLNKGGFLIGHLKYMY